MKSNLPLKIFAVILLVPLIALIFGGCQPAPQRNTESSLVESPVYSNEFPTEDGDNSSQIIAITTTKIPESPAHIEKSASAGDVTLTINADVSAPECDALYLYDFKVTSGVSEDVAKAMASVMGEVNSFEKTGDYGYDFYLAERPNELYSIEAFTNRLALFGHTDNLCPYSENVHSDPSAEILTNYTREQAAEKCLEMYGKIYDGDSVVLDMFSFGATIGLDYYKITAAPIIDNIPVISDKAYAEFDVSEKGINKVHAYRFEVENAALVDEILPLSECVETAAEKAALLMIFPNRADYNCYNYTLNEDGILTNINIEKIQLAYIVQRSSDGSYSLCPAWVFISGTDSLLDYSCAFAVNAVTGDVVRL